MSQTIDFIFDFGSPNAYLAWQVLPGLAARSGARLNPIACLLGGIFKATGNQSPMQAFAGVPLKMAYERREMQRFIERHGLLAFRMNPHFPVNTLAIMRGAAAAQIDGHLVPYMNAMFHHMWEAPKKLDDPQVLRDALGASDFDADALLARMQAADVKQRLVDNTSAAVARGVFGSPSFLVGDELWFGKDRLRDVEDYLGR